MRTASPATQGCLLSRQRASCDSLTAVAPSPGGPAKELRRHNHRAAYTLFETPCTKLTDSSSSHELQNSSSLF